MAFPYVGSKITLISHSEIRYEGTLHEIDKEKQTVSLVNVRSFGTEGRRQDLHIKPKPTPFNLIVFRGQDIKDLNVQQATVEEDANFEDPAILSAEATASVPVAAPVVQAKQAKPSPAPAPARKVPAATTAKQQSAAAKTLAEAKKASAAARRKKKEEDQKIKKAAVAAAAAKVPKLPEAKDPNIAVKAPASAEEWASRTAGGRFHPTRLNHRWKQEQAPAPAPQHNPHHHNNNNNNNNQRGSRPGMGTYVGGRAGGGRGPTVNAADANIDIAATSAALEAQKQKIQQELDLKDEGPKYNPSNFFDNLGSSSISGGVNAGSGSKQPSHKAKPNAAPGHLRRQQENTLNLETFGGVVHPHPQQQQQRRPPNNNRNNNINNNNGYAPQGGAIGGNKRYYPRNNNNNTTTNNNSNAALQGSHNRYGAHNRVGHHNYKRSQGQQQRSGGGARGY